MSSQQCGPKALSLNIGSLCRLTPAVVDSILAQRDLGRIGLFASAVIAAGGFAYGFCFGVWRSMEQGLYSAIKLPLLLFADR
jgi:hypothetical protein